MNNPHFNKFSNTSDFDYFICCTKAVYSAFKMRRPKPKYKEATKNPIN